MDSRITHLHGQPLAVLVELLKTSLGDEVGDALRSCRTVAALPGDDDHNEHALEECAQLGEVGLAERLQVTRIPQSQVLDH